MTTCSIQHHFKVNLKAITIYISGSWMGTSSWSCSCATPSMSLSDSWAPACHDCCNMLSHLQTLMSILKSLQMHEHFLMQTKSLGLRWNLKCCRIAVRCSRLSPSQPAPGEQKCLQLLHSSPQAADLAQHCTGCNAECNFCHPKTSDASCTLNPQQSGFTIKLHARRQGKK